MKQNAESKISKFVNFYSSMIFQNAKSVLCKIKSQETFSRKLRLGLEETKDKKSQFLIKDISYIAYESI